MSDSIKQTVQWFPGHMAKTRRLIKENLKQVDLVAEILDARIPYSSRNPEIDEIVSSKPRIILLNKCDMADDKITSMWIDYFSSSCYHPLSVDCRTGKGLNAFIPLVRKILSDVIKSNADKGMPGKTLRVMVVGIPNTGKSTFINRMIGKNKAKTENRPGITKSNQWFNIGNGVELLDTPGVLWPKFEDRSVGDKIAFIGSIKDSVIDPETMAVRLIDILKTEYSVLFKERYKLTDTDISVSENWELLELIGKKRGMLISGGEVNTERAANMLLEEYRNGKLGKISFEKP